MPTDRYTLAMPSAASVALLPARPRVRTTPPAEEASGPPRPNLMFFGSFVSMSLQEYGLPQVFGRPAAWVGFDNFVRAVTDERLAGPLVYVTLGTVFNDPELVRSVLDAVVDLEVPEELVNPSKLYDAHRTPPRSEVRSVE